jgi:sugar/nucleoside kinase (ribokinase family)
MIASPRGPSGRGATAAPPLGPVVCVGVHILDVLGRPVTEIPPGQNSVVLEEIRATAAGTAAGTSVDLAKLGVEVQNIGAIGDDALGDLLLALLRKNGVDAGLLLRKSGRRTSATILPIRPNGERPALHAPGADHYFEPADFGAAHVRAFESAAAVHVGAPDMLSAFPPGELAPHLAAARARGAIVTMDLLRAGVGGALEPLAPVLEQVDWFLPNEQQLRASTGRDDLGEAAEVARGLGAAAVGVTCGADGCVLFHDDVGEVAVPALPVDVVDTTGCGDGFDAGFITALLLGSSPVEAAWLGVACGSLVATGLGSDAGIESLEGTLSLLEARAPAPDGRKAASALRRMSETRASVVGTELEGVAGGDRS